MLLLIVVVLTFVTYHNILILIRVLIKDQKFYQNIKMLGKNKDLSLEGIAQLLYGKRGHVILFLPRVHRRGENFHLVGGRFHFLIYSFLMRLQIAAVFRHE